MSGNVWHGKSIRYIVQINKVLLFLTEGVERVPGVGIEPTQPFGYEILSLARIPVPPPGHVAIVYP